MLKFLDKYKKVIFILMLLVAYILYTRPTKLHVCTIPDKVEMIDISIHIFKDDFSEWNEQSAFIKDEEKIKQILDFLNQYSFRKKIHIPNQPAERAQKNTVSIIFHYKDKNDIFDIDIFEIGNEGKIRIAQSLHGPYIPYTMGWIGKKQELNLHKEFSQILDGLFANEFELKTHIP